MTWRNGHVEVHWDRDRFADRGGPPPRMGTGEPLTADVVRRALTTERPRGLYVVSVGTAEWARERLGRTLRTLGDLAAAMEITEEVPCPSR